MKYIYIQLNIIRTYNTLFYLTTNIVTWFSLICSYVLIYSQTYLQYSYIIRLIGCPYQLISDHRMS
jgi:hypothetical protein